MKNSFTQSHFFLRYLSLVLSAFIFFITCILIIRFFIVSPGRVNGRSMEPYFIDEEFFFVNKFIYLFSSPKRYDIVQIIDPESKQLMVKRIIGLPNETIVVKRGTVYLRDPVSGEETELNESRYLPKHIYTKITAQTHPVSFILEPHEFFILGDNRPQSVDSRYYGPIHRSEIVGRVIFSEKEASLAWQK